MRLKYAHALICGTDLPLKQIAEQCGYNDYFQFNAIFKKYYGVSPISFREKFHRSSGTVSHCFSPGKNLHLKN